MIAVIGDVKRVPLRIFQGQDLDFDISWFEADGTTPINMADARAQIRAAAGTPVLFDLSNYITIDGNTPNVAHVLVPASATIALEPAWGVWDLNATADDSGEVKKLMRGYARIIAGITDEVGS